VTREAVPAVLRGAAEGIDEHISSPGFLRLLGAVPRALERLRTGVVEGRRAAPGEGGRFLFRGHREYRPGDDLRRVDWKVAARLGRHLVREYDAERDLLTQVWLDGSASLGPFGGRRATARAAAPASAVGLAAGGRTCLGILREGDARILVDASQSGHLPAFLRALTAERPHGRAHLARGLPLLIRHVPRQARVLLLSDFLSRADPGVLHAFAGRGIRGALLHLRVPEVTAPRAVGTISLRDAESGVLRTIDLDPHLAAQIAKRAKAHADRWAHHAAAVGFQYLPFAPSTRDEDVLRRLVEEVS
jgi:uncharacterized protein (DUF58 family)